jgi:hypothetical protein
VVHALKERRRLGDMTTGVVIADLSGGPAALLPGRTQAQLISVLQTGDATGPRWSVRAWLECRQARRSSLVVAPDRPTAVAYALRMKLDLSRIRIEPDLGSAAALTRLMREMDSITARARAWHSAGR